VVIKAEGRVKVHTSDPARLCNGNDIQTAFIEMMQSRFNNVSCSAFCVLDSRERRLQSGGSVDINYSLRKDMISEYYDEDYPSAFMQDLKFFAKDSAELTETLQSVMMTIAAEKGVAIPEYLSTIHVQGMLIESLLVKNSTGSFIIIEPTPQVISNKEPRSAAENGAQSSAIVAGALGAVGASLALAFCYLRCRKPPISKSPALPKDVSTFSMPSILTGLTPKAFTRTSWEVIKERWGFLSRYEYSEEKRRALIRYLADPKYWGMSWTGLMDFEAQAKEHFAETYTEKTMLDCVQELVKETCAVHGAPAALVHNDWEVFQVEDFVTHCWAEPFVEFLASLRQAYNTRLRKPKLFICAFALYQGNSDDISGAIGERVEDAPFVKALRASSRLTVVRNSRQDLYSRCWCLIELIYAQDFGMYPDEVLVTGPNTFGDSKISCLDAKASSAEDREKILLTIVSRKGKAKQVDEQLHVLRSMHVHEEGP